MCLIEFDYIWLDKCYIYQYSMNIPACISQAKYIASLLERSWATDLVIHTTFYYGGLPLAYVLDILNLALKMWQWHWGIIALIETWWQFHFQVHVCYCHTRIIVLIHVSAKPWKMVKMICLTTNSYTGPETQGLLLGHYTMEDNFMATCLLPLQQKPSIVNLLSWRIKSSWKELSPIEKKGKKKTRIELFPL